MVDSFIIPENSTSQYMYIEEYTPTKIVISNSTNNDYLKVDEHNNNLFGDVNLGKVVLNRVIKYNYSDYLLLHNKNKDNYCLCNKTTNIIDFDSKNENIYYKIGAKYIHNVELIDNSKIKKVQDYDIFLIYVNNVLINDFTNDSNYVILGEKAKKELKLLDNNITILVYKTNQTLVESIEIEYLGVKSYLDINSMVFGNYFENNNIQQVLNYENLRYDENTDVSYIGNFTKRKVLSKIVKYKLSFEYFYGKGVDNIYSKYKNKKFRVIILNPTTNTIDIYINCDMLINGGKTYTKEKNSYKVEIATDGFYNISYDNMNYTIINSIYK